MLFCFLVKLFGLVDVVLIYIFGFLINKNFIVCLEIGLGVIVLVMLLLLVKFINGFNILLVIFI